MDLFLVLAEGVGQGDGMGGGDNAGRIHLLQGVHIIENGADLVGKAIDPADLDSWLKKMSAEPNHVGSEHNRANAEMTLEQFKAWGWDARIETFDVLYPTPKKISLDLVEPVPQSIGLTEPPVPGDEATYTDDALPAYLAYQGDGDVTAPLVYVNFGMPDDYETLQRMGVSVEGKVVIARYGAGWRARSSWQVTWASIHRALRHRWWRSHSVSQRRPSSPP